MTRNEDTIHFASIDAVNPVQLRRELRELLDDGMITPEEFAERTEATYRK
jgi:hypothetical protein